EGEFMRTSLPGHSSYRRKWPARWGDPGCSLVRCFQDCEVVSGLDGGDFLDLAGGPVDGQGLELGPLGKAEEGAVVAVGGVARAAFHEAEELVAGGFQDDAGANG